MSKRSRSDYSMLNIIAGMGGYAVSLIMGIICRMAFTRTLEADYLGINGLFTNILSMLSLAELGIGSAIGYALYKPLAEDDRPKVASLMRFYAHCYTIIGVVIAILGVCLLPFLDLLIKDVPSIKENIHVVYLLFLFNTATSYFFSYRCALLTAAQQHYIVIGISYLVMIIQNIVQIIVLLTTKSYMLYLFVFIIGGLAYNVIVSLVAKKRFPYIVEKNIAPLEKEEKSKLVSNVRALTIWKLSSLLVNQSDNIIITYFNGLIAVGMASNYTLLCSTLQSLVNLVFNGITASVGNHNALEDSQHKYALFNSINLANFWLFGWVSIGLFVCSSDMVHLLFGARYVLPVQIPFIIALNFYMVGMQNAVWTYKNTMGIFRQGRYLLILTAAINIVTSIWLGKRMGLFGIYLATAISRLCTNTWYDPYAIHKYGFGISVRPYFWRYLRYAALCVATGAICYGLCSLLPFGLLINVLLKILICSAVCNGIFFICFRGSAEFSYLLRFADKVIVRLFDLLKKIVRRH